VVEFETFGHRCFVENLFTASQVRFVWAKRWENRLSDNIVLRMALQGCHYPPETSKWHKTEHRLFRHIRQSWRGKPLTSPLIVVEPIAATTTTTGLTVGCELDTRTYPKGAKVCNAKMATLNIEGCTFDGEWNYTISPKTEV
jgi:hypothetical protein